MTPRDLRNIHTTGNDCSDALPCTNMALKLPLFYLLMEKPPGCYLQVWSPYYQVAQCNQKTPIPVSWRWQVRSEKAKKGYASTLIITATILVIIFWDNLMFEKILVSPQVKWIVIISNKRGIYELPHELPINLRLRTLGN